MLLAYAKLALHDDLLDSAVPDDPYLARELSRYFPRELRERFPDADRSPSPAPRDHRDQLANAIDQPRRPGLRRAPGRRDRRRCATIAMAYRGGAMNPSA